MNKQVCEIIQKYYEQTSLAYHYLLIHSKCVMQKALQIAERLQELNPDVDFIAEAAMLHDIGIIKCNANKLGCYGTLPYIAHGYVGREMLQKEGLMNHALVCERHVGVGLTVKDIIDNNFPLPHRDMVAQTLEEKIICFADKFYSKSAGQLEFHKPIDVVRKEILKYGKEKLKIFDEWAIFFKEPLPSHLLELKSINYEGMN
ncbi:MAG: HD domain-containing protein [Thermodesulfovibrionales bacterium]|nr:HD domain-containing protein [Thermodesulfovibrionales bacterium]